MYLKGEKMIRICSFALCLAILTSCSGKTTVILLPDQENPTGAVVVKTDRTAAEIDKPYESITVTSDLPSPVKPLNKDEVEKKYSALLQAQPARPVHFILYFLQNSTQMDQASKALIPNILKASRERAPSEISIIGHSDTKGSHKFNVRLSLERARAVERFIRENAPGIKEILVQSFGESELLIPTEDNVSEGRNRRVEVMIR